MPGKPLDGWNEILHFVQDVNARFSELREVISADHERFDDWASERDHDRDLFRAEVTRQMQFLGRNVEEAMRKLDSHLGSHKLRDSETRKEAAALGVAKLDNRTKVILALIALAQFIIGLLVGRAGMP